MITAQDIRFLLFMDTKNISTVFISTKTRILIKLSKLFKLELVCSKCDSGNLRAGKKFVTQGEHKEFRLVWNVATLSKCP